VKSRHHEPAGFDFAAFSPAARQPKPPASGSLCNLKADSETFESVRISLLRHKKAHHA
jgi:hypothetical protein